MPYFSKPCHICWRFNVFTSVVLIELDSKNDMVSSMCTKKKKILHRLFDGSSFVFQKMTFKIMCNRDYYIFPVCYFYTIIPIVNYIGILTYIVECNFNYLPGMCIGCRVLHSLNTKQVFISKHLALCVLHHRRLQVLFIADRFAAN